MMFGSREVFAYLECADCASLQIAEVPRDLSKYYPSHYYSLAADPPPAAAPSWLRGLLRRARTRQRLGYSSPLGRWLCARSDDWFATRSGFSWNWFRNVGVDIDSRILDVGCGSGLLLQALWDNGFRDLTGVDPYRDGDHIGAGLKLLRRRLVDLQGTFDFVMFHHSLEHVTDPAEDLAHVISLLAPGGHLLVRIPVADTYGWRTYRTNWFALDPPRHIAIPSARGLATLAERIGLKLTSTTYECDHVILLASEQYSEGQPWMSPGSFRTDPARFTKNKQETMRRLAADLNARRDGDVAAFVFERA